MLRSDLPREVRITHGPWGKQEDPRQGNPLDEPMELISRDSARSSGVNQIGLRDSGGGESFYMSPVIRKGRGKPIPLSRGYDCK